MKRIVALLISIITAGIVFAETTEVQINNNLYLLNMPICYYVDDTPRPGKQSSIVEERLNKSKNKNKRYNPALSKYVNFMTANEYRGTEYPNTSSYTRQFMTHNEAAVKYEYAGVQAYYRQMQCTIGDSLSSTTRKVSQLGFGVGSPNVERLKVMFYLLANDLSGISSQNSDDYKYAGIKAQIAKRFVSQGQFVELGAEYESWEVPDNTLIAYGPYFNDYFSVKDMDWAFTNRKSAYIYTSSVTNRYQEPNNFSGIGSASSPMLLVNGIAHAFIVSGSISKRGYMSLYTSEQTKTKLDILFPFNLSNFVGLDLAYQYNQSKQEEQDLNQSGELVIDKDIYERTILKGGFRFTILSDDWVRLVGGAEYQRYKSSEATEYLDFFGKLVVKVTHHVALIGNFQHYNEWLLDKGAFEFKPAGYHFGAALSARL